MNTNSLDILVVGAGALGSFMGGWLARSTKANVSLIGRPDHIAAIRARGLQIKLLDWQGTVKLDSYTSVHDVSRKPDLIILTVRAYQTDEALQEVVSAFGTDIPVLTFQNGNLLPRIADVISSKYTLGGTTVINAKLVGSGSVEQSNSAPFIIGEMNGGLTSRITDIQQVFNDAGMECRISSNISGEIWGKMIINSNTNTLSGVSNLTVREMYDSIDLRRFSYGLVSEGFTIAMLDGVDLANTSSPLVHELSNAIKSPDDFDNFAEEKARTMRDFKLSMSTLLARGIKTEVDYTNGFIANRAKVLKSRAPHHEAITRLIKEIEKGQRSPDPTNVAGIFCISPD